MDNICEVVRKAEENLKHGVTQKSTHVSVSFKEDLDTIDAYLDSKFISGDTDSLGRLKPFFNIVLGIRNIWFRATDIDRKNIRIKAKNKSSQTMMAFLASIHLQNWMKETNFGQFLNNWGLTLASYNEAIIKFVEKDGELIPSVIPWQQVICDTVDFENNPVIEKLYFTPAQLRQNASYDQEMVEALIFNKSTRRTMSGRQKDNKADYIEVYEIHGELPLSYLTGEEKDEATYQQQMHVISFQGTKNDGDYTEYTLYSGREKQSPYMLTSLIPETDGSIGLKGAVKYLFQAQWMVNHAAKLIKDQLELASKIIFQTSDGNFIGRNAMTQIENGDVLITSQNQPLTQLNNKPDIAAMQSFGQEWQVGGAKVAGISEAMMGDNPPSGTAWRQVQAMLQESHSLFKIMRQNRAFYIEQMLEKFVGPFLKRKMDTTEEIGATLEAYQIKKIDSAYVPKEAIRLANEQIKQDILSGKITEAPDLKAIGAQIQSQLNELGNQRFIKPSDISTKRWKDVLKDFVGMFECDPTSENADTQAIMATYDTALKFIIGLQGRPMTPVEEYLFNGLISQTGHLSPIELSNLNSQVPQAPQLGQPVMPAVGGQRVEAGKLLTQPIG